MCCNRFIGETLVHALWLLDRSVVSAAAAMYQEATGTLFWQGTSQALPHVVDLFHV